MGRLESISYITYKNNDKFDYRNCVKKFECVLLKHFTKGRKENVKKQQIQVTSFYPFVSPWIKLPINQIHLGGLLIWYLKGFYYTLFWLNSPIVIIKRTIYYDAASMSSCRGISFSEYQRLSHRRTRGSVFIPYIFICIYLFKPQVHYLPDSRTPPLS